NGGNNRSLYTIVLAALSQMMANANNSEYTLPVVATTQSVTTAPLPLDPAGLIAMLVNGVDPDLFRSALHDLLQNPHLNLYISSTDGLELDVGVEGEAAADSTTTVAGGTEEVTVPPVLTVVPAAVEEGDSGTSLLTFTLQLDRAATAAVTVRYDTADGTATADSDYSAVGDIATIAVGESSVAVSVSVSGDKSIEADETLQFTLTAVTNATFSDGTTASMTTTGTITNDDNGPELSLADIAVAEGDAGSSDLELVVTFSGSANEEGSFSYSVTGGTATAGSDYTASGGTITFASGAQGAVIPLVIAGDRTPEQNETLTVTLTAAVKATVADAASAVITITDDDTVIPEVTVAGGSVAEGNRGTTTLLFTVTLSSATSQDVVVTYATADGSATTGVDYEASSGSVTISAGNTTTTIPVSIYGDSFLEGDETLTLTLTAPQRATLGATATTTGTITEDDCVDKYALTPSLTIFDSEVDEGDSGTTDLGFTLLLSGTAPGDVDVTYTVTDGTATLADNDYVSPATSLITIPAGSLSGEVVVTVNGDERYEADETVTVEITNPANATLCSPTVATGTIREDGDTFYSNSLGMEFHLISSGSFTMGSPPTEVGREENETTHEVTLTRPYFMQTTEVTQGQWQQVMANANPSSSVCSDCPVEQVSWDDVQTFLTAINGLGLGSYALPTEAEWEYAARAGSTTPLSAGSATESGCTLDTVVDSVGWYCANATATTHSVAGKVANSWGLYDSYGNVWEWVHDGYDTNYGGVAGAAVTDPEGPSATNFKVIRGGGWNSELEKLRSAARANELSTASRNTIGFRLRREP
ncbi:MAG: SUMF1/EgtB/PvdO family nonheme iron enzyme, partial [Gammaproteobacteria bacterium]|nr:SUMF1/EgtB/PvdO family nonheme iron enzyme [Gammaproteobacteria bacterium]